jgi:putative peptidoglycan lipid II flippase
MRNRLLGSSLVVAMGYALSRLLGLGRDIVITLNYGTSAELDAFRASFGIIDMVYLVVAGGALGSAFIPVFSEYLTAGERRRAWQLAHGVLTITAVGLLAACAAVAAFAEPLVRLSVGRGFDAATQRMTADMLRLMLLQPMLLGIGALLKATLESHDRFTLPSIAASTYNLGIIIGALSAPWLGITGLVWGVNLGALGFIITQLPGLRGLGMLATWPRFADVPRVWWLFWPRLIGQSTWQINLIVIASLASLLGVGAVAANGIALQLMMVPHGLIALSIGTVLFPTLARQYAAERHDDIRATLTGAMRVVLFLALPLSVGLGLLAAPVIRLLFERGAFDAQSTALTATAFGGYAVGLAAFALAEIVVRAFYAMHDTRTPVIIACGAVVVNITLGIWLTRVGYGLAGLGLAFSIANLAEAAALVVLMQRRIGGLGGVFWRSAGDSLAGAALVGVALIALQTLALRTGLFGDGRGPENLWALLGWCALNGAIGAAAYIGWSSWRGSPELATVTERLRRRVLRR